MYLTEIPISDLCKKVTWCIESEMFIVEMTSGLFKIEEKITSMRWKKLSLRDVICEELQMA